MKDNANLEYVLSALQKSKFIKDKYIEINLLRHDCFRIVIMCLKNNYMEYLIWQLNKQFSEQSEETKETLNKIL